MKCSKLLRFQCYAILVRLCTWWHRNCNSPKLGCLCLLLEHLEDHRENVWTIYFDDCSGSSSFTMLIRTRLTILPALTEESEVFYFALPDPAECVDIIISKATKLNAKALWIPANFKLSKIEQGITFMPHFLMTATNTNHCWFFVDGRRIRLKIWLICGVIQFITHSWRKTKEKNILKNELNPDNSQ